MIPMRGENHGLRFKIRIAARNHCDDVAGLDLPDLGRNVSTQAHAQWNWVKVFRIGDREHLIYGLPGHPKKFFASLFRQPAGKSERRLTGGQLQLWIFPAPGTSHHIVTVSGGGSGVDYEDGLRTAPRCFFVFVSPTA